MTMKKNINVVVIQEGPFLVAQCLEYDINCQADSFDELEESFNRAYVGEILLSLDNEDEKLFQDINPAPEFYRNMFKNGRKLGNPWNINPRNWVQDPPRRVISNIKATVSIV